MENYAQVLLLKWLETHGMVGPTASYKFADPSVGAPAGCQGYALTLKCAMRLHRFRGILWRLLISCRFLWVMGG